MITHSKPSRRFGGRDQSRLAFENLESRRCMAVTATFEAGILSVVGDAGPNAVELFQPADRAVVVTGDGATWTFSGVDEIVVATGDGDDRARSSKPKEIVVVGSKIKYEMGAGNDSVRIDDGGSTDRPTLFNTSLVAAVDLGSGADQLSVDVRRHDDVEIDVIASDGGDGVAVGMLLPAVQKVRQAAARLQMQLVGGGNLIAAETRRVDDVNLLVRSSSQSTAARPLNDAYTFIFQGNSQATDSLELVANLSAAADEVSVDTRDFGQTKVFLNTGAGDDSARVTEQTRQITLVQDLAPPTVVLDLTMGDGDDDVSVDAKNGDPFTFARDFKGTGMVIDLGGGNNRARIDCEGYAYLTQKVVGGDGDDAVAMNSRLFVGNLSLDSSDAAPAHELTIDLGHGNNRFAASLVSPPPGPVPIPYPNISLAAVINSGDGSDDISLTTSGVANLSLDLTTGAGDDSVATKHKKWLVSNFEFSLPSIDADLDLGAGRDRLIFETEGYAEVDSLVDLGDGNDSAAIRHRMFAIVDRTNLVLNMQLGAGRDFVVLDTHNYREVTTTFDTGPAGDSRDFVFASHSFRPSRSGWTGWSNFYRSLDGGRDYFAQLALGYDAQSTVEGQQITVVLRRLANPHLPG